MISRYPNASQKEKAEIESSLWRALSVAERRTYKHSYRYIKLVLPDASARDIGARHMLLGAGAIADCLWPEIDAGRVTPSRAYDIVKYARKQSADRATQRDVIEETLKRYLTSGKIKPEKKNNGIRPTTTSNATADVIAAYYEEQLLNPDDLADLTKQIRADVAALFEDYRQCVRTLNARAKLDDGDEVSNPPVTRRRVRDAFTTLGMSIPRPSAKIDLAVVARQKRKLARMYHPDLTGNEDLREAYEAVINAYLTIEQYKEENHV